MITRRSILSIPGALLVASCGAAPPPPAVLTLAMNAGPDVNPGASGGPTAVAVRLYQLTATAKFERADVFALTEREQATLGTDSLGSEEFVLKPGESRTITRDLKKDVQFVGVVALFRDIDHAKWRAFAPVAASGPTRRALTISRLSVSLA